MTAVSDWSWKAIKRRSTHLNLFSITSCHVWQPRMQNSANRKTSEVICKKWIILAICSRRRLIVVDLLDVVVAFTWMCDWTEASWTMSWPISSSAQRHSPTHNFWLYSPKQSYVSSQTFVLHLSSVPEAGEVPRHLPKVLRWHPRGKICCYLSAGASPGLGLSILGRVLHDLVSINCSRSKPFTQRVCWKALCYANTHFSFQILRQAKENGASVKSTGGSFPVVASPREVVIDIRYINRLVGLDIYQKTWGLLNHTL